MKILESEHGQSFTKNLGNYESLKVYNGITVELEGKETVKSTHPTLRTAMEKLNEQDVKRLA